MTGLALFLAVAAAAFGCAHRLRLPVIPLLMVGGILINLFAGGLIDDAWLADTLSLGLAFLVFSSGIELNPARFQPQRHAVPWVALIQFTLIGAAGFLAASALGFAQTPALYLALALSASSTLVALRHLKQHQQMFEPFGRLVIGVLLVQDALMIILITILAGGNKGAAFAALHVGAIVLLGASAVLLQKTVMPWALRKLHLDEETLLLGFLAVLFLFVGAAWLLQIPIIAGAFFAGLSLSATPVNGVVRGLLNSLNDFFLALFFTALGAIIVLPGWEFLLKGLALAAVVVIVTPPVVTIIAEWTGLSSRASIESGLLLAQTSEFSMVLALSGLAGGHIDERVFSLIALITVVTMTITPFVATDAVTWRLLHFHPARERFDFRSDFKDHILMIGFGTGGMWTLRPLTEAGWKVVVIDDDPAVVAQLARNGVACIRGDGSDPRVLDRASARRARAILAATPRPSDSEKILRHTAAHTTVLVRTFEDHDAERIRALGGIPILNSLATAETFMKWFGTLPAK